MKLRPYQQKAVNDIHNAWNSGDRVVMLRLPTGGGKTPTFSYILAQANCASVVIAHRSELVIQSSMALAHYGVRHKIIGPKTLVKNCINSHQLCFSKHFIDPNAKIAVAGVDTLIKQTPDYWHKQVGIWVCDEGHHLLRENKWGIAAKMFPNARGLAVTATPLRLDGKGLGAHADGLAEVLIHGPEMRDLIDMGYLTDAKIYCPPSDVDVSGVRISASGDFNPQDVSKAVHSSKKIVGDAVSHYQKFAAGKLGITFAVDIESAEELTVAYNKAGIPAEIITGKTDPMRRAYIMRDFKARKILQLVNVDILGEGTDVPAVEVVSMCRPTNSFTIFAQQYGRMLRLLIPDHLQAIWDTFPDAARRAHIAESKKPRGILLDHVGNVMRHGLPDAFKEWTLDARERRSSKKSDAIPIRICINETCVQPYERIYKACPYCGTVPPITQRGAPEFVDGDLTELDPIMLAKLRGEAKRIEGEFYPPHGLDYIAQMGARKRHVERREAQRDLKNSIAWWAGLHGGDESEAYRKFYFKFGVDVATSQTLGTREASELKARIDAELLENDIDASVNAEVFLQNR